MSGAFYFVTWRINKVHKSLSPHARDIVVEALCRFHGNRYRIHAYVVMDDHVHVIVQPLGTNTLQDVVRRWKSYTANRIQRIFGLTSAIWQDEYMDRIIRDEAEFRQKGEYILANPQKRWPEELHYPWVGLSPLGPAAKDGGHGGPPH